MVVGVGVGVAVAAGLPVGVEVLVAASRLLYPVAWARVSEPLSTETSSLWRRPVVMVVAVSWTA